MDYTDFSQTGGFPFDADVLDFNQKALAEVLKWPACQADGTYPPLIILSGCGDVQGNDFIEDGWMLLNGEVIPFRGSYANQSNPDGQLFLVETRQQATFQNGQTYNVLEVTRYLTCDPVLGAPAQVGNIYQIPRLEQIVGSRAAGQDGWKAFTGTNGPITWKVELRRNLLTRLVYLRGEATINAAAVPATAIRYSLSFPFPAGYAPSADLAFGAQHDYHSFTNPADPPIRSIACKIFNSGGWQMAIAPVKPADPTISSYKVLFHTVYPMD